MPHFSGTHLSRKVWHACISTRNGTSSHGNPLFSLTILSWLVVSRAAAFRPEQYFTCDQVSFCCLAAVDADGCHSRGHGPSRFPDVLAELPCSEGEGQLPSTGDLPSQEPRQVLEINQELLQSGAVTLPGEHGCRAVWAAVTKATDWVACENKFISYSSGG